MDVDQFIHDTGLKMDRPIHIGKRVASWATGILDSNQCDCWYAVLEVNGKEIPVYWHSSINECSDLYTPNLLDFLEKVQAVLIHCWGRVAYHNTEDVELYWDARRAFDHDRSMDLMDLDIHSAVRKGKANGAQRA